MNSHSWNTVQCIVEISNVNVIATLMCIKKSPRGNPAGRNRRVAKGLCAATIYYLDCACVSSRNTRQLCSSRGRAFTRQRVALTPPHVKDWRHVCIGMFNKDKHLGYGDVFRLTFHPLVPNVSFPSNHLPARLHVVVFHFRREHKTYKWLKLH